MVVVMAVMMVFSQRRVRYTSRCRFLSHKRAGGFGRRSSFRGGQEKGFDSGFFQVLALATEQSPRLGKVDLLKERLASPFDLSSQHVEPFPIPSFATIVRVIGLRCCKCQD
jgi:hypothetical protein